jgi:dCTP deaminase
MSVLIKHEIIELIKSREITFSPALDALQFRPHAVDLRLGNTFRIPKRSFAPNKANNGRSAVVLDHLAVSDGQFAHYEEITLKPGQYFDILPGEWIMGYTHEAVHIKSNTLMGILYPRSSVNRRGLALDLTGIVDTGYKGNLMIPIHNTTSMQVLRLYPGERICQLVFERLEQPAREGYVGRYQGGAKGYQIDVDSREIELIRAGELKKIKKEFKLSA